MKEGLDNSLALLDESMVVLQSKDLFITAAVSGNESFENNNSSFIQGLTGIKLNGRSRQEAYRSIYEELAV